MGLKTKFNRQAWEQDHMVRTHCIWDFKRTRKNHMNEKYAKISIKHHPLYEKAKKHGDIAAAQQVVEDLLSNDALARIKNDLMGRAPIIVVPSLTQYDPNNVIPMVYAHILAKEFDLEICDYIFEQEGQGRTSKNALYRIFHQPYFKSEQLPAGQDFLVADDVITMGGTMANLVQYIENNGARVIATTALADGDSTNEARKRRAPQDFLLNAKKDVIDAVREKFGKDIESSLKRIAGISYGSLTDREAGFLLHKATPEDVRATILQLENTPQTTKGFKTRKRDV